MSPLNKKQAELLLTFDDKTARSSLDDLQYNIFSLMKKIAKVKYGESNERNDRKIVMKNDR